MPLPNLLSRVLSSPGALQRAYPKSRTRGCLPGQVLPTVGRGVDGNQLDRVAYVDVVAAHSLNPFPPRPAFGFGLDWYDATGIIFLPFRLALASIVALPS